jgi:hypothetical protein
MRFTITEAGLKSQEHCPSVHATPTRHVRTALVVVATGFAATHLQNVVQDALQTVTQKLSVDNMANLDNRIVRLTCAAPNLGRQNKPSMSPEIGMLLTRNQVLRLY